MLTPRCRNTRPAEAAQVAADALLETALVLSAPPPPGRVDKRELHRAIGYGRPRRRPC